VPLSIRVAKVKAPDALIGRSAPPPLCNTRPEPESPMTVPPKVYVAGGGPPPPPPQATKRKARPITDPIKRNMMIPPQVFADGEQLSLKACGCA
jgi:hypothetical protein